MTLTNGEELEFEESGAHLERAYGHRDAGELEGALQECDRAIELAPEWAEAHNLRGVVLDEMGWVEEAIAAYEEAVWLPVAPSFPPKAVQCVLLERSRKLTVGAEEEPRQQVAFMAYHTDALYRVGWLAYVGPKAPFTQELAAHLVAIGCDLDLK